jgi:RNA chaperone Hfq
MSQYNSQVQNMFLSQMRKKHQRVEVILETGNTLRGKLKGYDQYSITLAFKDKLEVIYKSSIIYITPLPALPERTDRRDNRRPSYNSSPRYEGGDYRERRPTSRVPNVYEGSSEYRERRPTTRVPNVYDDE